MRRYVGPSSGGVKVWGSASCACESRGRMEGWYRCVMTVAWEGEEG